MDFNKQLYEEIEDEFNRLRGIEVGSSEYKTTVDGLTKLVDKAIEIEKIDIENEEKAKRQAEAKENAEFERQLKLRQEEEARALAEFDKNFRTKQMEEERKDRLIRNCMTAAGIVIPSLITIWGTCKSFEFEKEGTITTIMGRGFINKLLPKK
jgi:hypothetical protein